MSTAGWLPAPAEELFGADATAEESYDLLTVDVPPSSWLTALETARTTLSCTFFDWLSAVDEPGTGFRVSAHVVALHPVRRLLVRTTVPHDAPALPSAVGVYAGAAWHERETHEMFGVVFEGHPGLEHLLLPETFEGHPLRKDFVLAARVAKAWPGAKEPGESEHGGPKRRQMLPPGVPDPNEWGPLKGQLPPAPARPARAAAGRAAGDRPSRAAGDRPVRRTRSASEGSASQAAQAGEAAAPGPADVPGAGAGAGAPARPRRMRSASEGSASQQAASAEDAATRKQGAAEGDATRAAAEGPAQGPAAEASVAHEPGPAPAPARPRRARSASEGSASQRPRAATDRSPAPRSSDAPWHHARPAFDEPESERTPEPEKTPEPERTPEPEPRKAAGSGQAPAPEAPSEARTGEAEAPDTAADSAETPERPERPETPDDPAGGPQ
ncbi:dehydrogenase [Streptomyces sp. FBKL.4005]|uniref:NADH-quinone oxidoreductase subunit C n=1 Tax=Streptomyces tricolor TaxID=68277 RepID=A0ABS9JKL0_9ACTN|nr:MULTISPECIES: NADH-quinone oxidoreductase subunit C [Streptomyces]MCG0066099.1 NADH-quinone oxidoreductase subunit C [Streptomyces tricolor]OYP15953.1 dehydrogenase [Streptomyces sp. FBKL.4005]